MKRDKSIGIIGLGFVGNAIKSSLDLAGVNLVLVDPAKGFNSTYQDLLKCDGIFVCVPTPERWDMACDPSILKDVLSKLKEVKYNGVIISKSTATPDVYKELQEEFPNLIHSPEFLTAAHAYKDYTNGTFAIIGGAVTAYKNEAERIIRLSQTELKQVVHCSIEEASLAKYGINSFLATKVVFMNELAKLAEEQGCDWITISRLLSLDKRIGHSHMQVPGPDGEYGFGGMCFPKDTKALLKYARTFGCELSVLDTATKKNFMLRLTGPKK
jgi:nucleotide sugar dehydrogenase